MGTQHPASEKQRLSCVTCNAPLPIGPEGEVEEPSYFADGSSGWTVDNEGHRDIEDFDQLCRYMMTVGDAIWDTFTMMELGERKDLDHLKLGILDERHAHLDTMRSLCFLLEDLESEAKRKVERFYRWVQKELDREEKKGTER